MAAPALGRRKLICTSVARRASWIRLVSLEGAVARSSSRGTSRGDGKAYACVTVLLCVRRSSEAGGGVPVDAPPGMVYDFGDGQICPPAPTSITGRRCGRRDCLSRRRRLGAGRKPALDACTLKQVRPAGGSGPDGVQREEEVVRGDFYVACRSIAVSMNAT